MTDLQIIRKDGRCEFRQSLLGTRRPNGYGAFSIHARNLSAHRLAYELTHGPIPPGLVVRHACDNPPCCNPAHLVLGTAKENSRDMVERGRSRGPATGSAHFGAKLTESQVIEIRRRRAAGERGVDLAAEFSVSETTVCRLWRNRGWNQVPTQAQT